MARDAGGERIGGAAGAVLELVKKHPQNFHKILGVFFTSIFLSVEFILLLSAARVL